MGFLDRLTERVEGFLDEVMLPDEVAGTLFKASRAIKSADYDEAMRLVERADAVHPGFQRTKHLKGLVHFYRGDYDEALVAFGQALDLREDAASHFYAGLASEKLERLHEAKVHFRRALEVDDSPPFEFDLRFGLGRVYLAQGRADKAVRELRKALKAWPDQPEAAVALARALLRRGEHDEARQILEADAAGSAGVEADVLRGQLEAAAGRTAAAQTAFEAALADEPNHPQALVGAAKASMALGAHAQANTHLLRALDQAPERERPDIHALLGQTYEAVGQPQRALAHYESALKTSPDAPHARLGAGRVLVELEDYDQARDHLHTLIAASPSDPELATEALVQLARCHVATGELAGARRLVDEALQRGGGRRAEIYALLGRIARLSGDAAEAVAFYQDALAALEQHGGEGRASIAAERDQALDELRPRFELPEAVRDATDLRVVLDALSRFLRSDARLDPYRQRLEPLCDALDAPLSIAIVGEFNAGKSTLLNAFLGEEVVPMGVLPTTAHTCYIQHGPRKTARIIERDGQVREVTLAEAKRQMKESAETIDHLEFLYPHPELRSVTFWDTPGFNALDASHEDTASRALEQAEAIVWVLDAGQALTQTEFERIESIPDGDERLIVLLNKVDRLDEAAVSEVVDHVEAHTTGQIAGCFALSAREALEARVQKGVTAAGRPAGAGSAPGDEGSPQDFEAFIDFLDARIIQRSGRIKAIEIGRQLGELVAEIEAFRAGLVAEYEHGLEATAALRGWLADQADQTPDERGRAEAMTLSDQFDFVLSAVDREIVELLHTRGPWFSRPSIEADDRRFVLELMRERIADVLDRSLQRVQTQVGLLESDIAERFGPVTQGLSLADVRTLNRRLEGFFDETRVFKLVLAERVYGQLRARATAQMDVAAEQVLSEAVGHGPDDDLARRGALRRLLPAVREPLTEQLSGWYTEFFLAAERFCDRVRRDLLLLELEAEHRYDVSELADRIR